MAAAGDELTHILRASGIVSTAEAVEILGCSAHYLRARLSKWIRPVRIGRGVFWRRSDIETYKADHPRLGQNRKVA